jgi:hypothetical protein
VTESKNRQNQTPETAIAPSSSVSEEAELKQGVGVPLRGTEGEPEGNKNNIRGTSGTVGESEGTCEIRKGCSHRGVSCSDGQIRINDVG